MDKTLRNNVAPDPGTEKKLTLHIGRYTFWHISGDTLFKCFKNFAIISHITLP
jgi:hypothetical protein